MKVGFSAIPKEMSWFEFRVGWPLFSFAAAVVVFGLLVLFVVCLALLCFVCGVWLVCPDLSSFPETIVLLETYNAV
ncbi:hypothetical protein QYF36_012768 [Acer negundo]|nr:hypothetical protein QYF36_012768 [Acer negundo]